MTRLFLIIFFFQRILHCDSNCSLRSRHVSVGCPPVCTNYCACCVPRFCLSSWEFGLFPSHHWPLSLFCVCYRRNWALRKLVCLETDCSDVPGPCAAPWLLTVSFHWWCMLAVFLCCVPFDALGLSSLCMYCSSVLSLLTHLPFAFYVHSLRSTRTSDPSSSLQSSPRLKKHFCHVCSTIRCVTKITCSRTDA